MGKLIRVLRRVKFRMMVLSWLRSMFQILFWCAAAGAVVIIVDRLVYLGEFVIWIPPAIVGVAICGASIQALLRPPSLFHAALVTDDMLRLEERLSSAYLLRDKSTRVARALRTDAAKAAGSLNPCSAVWYAFT